MNKRYQVFVSSTYEDLIKERQEVMQVLLESDCIPAGMELFPAADVDSWSLIKKVIDQSDYYVLILAGRYGSIGLDSIGYTEMEYRYALEKNIPTISFLHKEPTGLIVSKTDQDGDKAQRLEAFRKLAQRKSVKYWTTAPELGALVGRSLLKLVEQSPAIGWVRGDSNLSNDNLGEVKSLYKQVSILEKRLSVENKKILSRPDELEGLTYKIKTPLEDSAIYVTINDVIIDGGKVSEHRRPFEIMLNSKNMDNLQWVAALTKTISLSFRHGVGISLIADELQSIFDPRGGYYKPGGKFIPSIIAEIGLVIEQHGQKLGLIPDTTSSELQLSSLLKRTERDEGSQSDI